MYCQQLQVSVLQFNDKLSHSHFHSLIQKVSSELPYVLGGAFLDT